jgi:hypothetical protein
MKHVDNDHRGSEQGNNGYADRQDQRYAISHWAHPFLARYLDA